jgi:hypothetical protein
VTFEADVLRFAQKTRTKVDMVVRKVVFDITSDIVRMTPVRDGFARNNYFWGVQRVGTIDPTKDKRGGASISRAAEFSTGLRAGGVVYLTNHLPYILKLEYGSSKQAPAGMARVTVAKFQRIVNAAVAGLR